MKKYRVEVNGAGSVYWIKIDTNKLHREDGPAVEHPGGTKAWYLNGLLHRVNGPAVEHSSGYKEYRVEGKLHREDGPAIIYPNGEEHYYINGKRLTLMEFRYHQRNNKSSWDGKIIEIDGKQYKLTEVK